MKKIGLLFIALLILSVLFIHLSGCHEEPFLPVMTDPPPPPVPVLSVTGGNLTNESLQENEIVRITEDGTNKEIFFI